MTDRATRAFPEVRVVVIGGGIAGCSVAYHLTERGWRDVVLLEVADERHPSHASFRAPSDPGEARIRH